MPKKGILERLSEEVVLGDGGYIVELERRGHVVAGAFTPEVAITHPEAIRELHYEMKNAGCEVLQVMAFYGSREKLATVGFADRTTEINQAAARIAQEVAGDDLLVAGDLSTTWKWRMTQTRTGSWAGCSTSRSMPKRGWTSSSARPCCAWTASRPRAGCPR